jgi:hypothetical protein
MIFFMRFLPKRGYPAWFPNSRGFKLFKLSWVKAQRVDHGAEHLGVVNYCFVKEL